MLIIGIAGGSGSGKTTVVRKIVENLKEEEVTVLSQDSYYYDNSHLKMEERQKINFDHPDSIEFSLLVEHLKQLKEGKTIKQPIYSYVTSSRLEGYELIKPCKVVIVEGILIFSHKELRDMIDIKVYVHADSDDRLVRMIRRDTVERGRSVSTVIQRYEDTVKPMFLQFIEPSKRYADLIMPEGGNNKVAVDMLTGTIRNFLFCD